MSVYGVAEIVLGLRFQRASLDNSRVVDQHIKTPVIFNTANNCRSAVVAPANIAHDLDYFTATVSQVSASSRQFVAVTRSYRNSCSLANQTARKNEAKASRTAGDEDNLIPETQGLTPNRRKKCKRAAGYSEG